MIDLSSFLFNNRERERERKKDLWKHEKRKLMLYMFVCIHNIHMYDVTFIFFTVQSTILIQRKNE